ncbi:hypothetical protein K488DRAFT_91265 [Vararia minispora EC-137]|uniref:Uncharacterized protein n=1 Tax=Vararia minispora EC-137 TaxID=1314806 RepID=A0ACB8Q5W5_9AGAM|nr:hypothetical protein K488DRAFT_91265 [Vararia minispora EC-137]
MGSMEGCAERHSIQVHDKADLRMRSRAFVVCGLLDDRSGADTPHAEDYIRLFRVYEDGHEELGCGEALATDLLAQGGPTYCAATTLHLVTPDITQIARLMRVETREMAFRLLYLWDGMTDSFAGHMNMVPDVHHCFWSCAALVIASESMSLREYAFWHAASTSSVGSREHRTKSLMRRLIFSPCDTVPTRYALEICAFHLASFTIAIAIAPGTGRSWRTTGTSFLRTPIVWR